MYYLCNGFIYCPVGTRPAAANVASAKREGMKKLVCLFLLLPLLARAGVNRITAPGRMSAPLPGEAHDGEYPLRRYLRAVDIADR